jgi:hypothetical protein
LSTTILEDAFDAAFHSGGTALAERGFGTATPQEILFRFQQNYGRPGYQEIKSALLRLTQPMDRMQPIEVMLRGIEEVQMFLLASPDEGRQLSEVNLIDHALIKLSETGGMYTKALETWNGRPPSDRKTWAQFREVMVRQYEKMLAEGSGTTLSQEGWGGAYNAIGTNDDDANSLTESIVKYAERATLAESKVSDLESCLSMLEMGGQTYTPPVNAAYFTPQAATFQHPAPPATIMVPPQPQMQMPPQQQPMPQQQQQWPGQSAQQQPSGHGSQQRRKSAATTAMDMAATPPLLLDKVLTLPTPNLVPTATTATMPIMATVAHQAIQATTTIKDKAIQDTTAIQANTAPNPVTPTTTATPKAANKVDATTVSPTPTPSNSI